MAPAPVELPYTEIAPPADLAPYVDRLWLRTALRAPERIHRVLPDGCVDVIVDAARATAALVGPMTRAIEVAGDPAEQVAVRFKPGTAAALTGCGLAELTDASVEIAALGLTGALADRVAGAAVAGGAPRLPARIPLSAISHARVAELVGWLRERLADAAPPDPRIARAVALLSSAARPGAAPPVGSTGEARVDDVADTLGMTRQHLARGFRREVGITPKQLARIARMQRAAAALRRGGDLARLAAELGYFDQSHFSRELRDLAGVTPAALAAERPIALSHLFGEPAP
ncbi:MAG TPA: helix-turn-helix transcriptional regulator [Kofleriaceae bacterium]|jgi:AraC-like DNA-binding protein|nr:helix-turn-helix transcriptional regulator [Kofleriaceae bacterium]